MSDQIVVKTQSGFQGPPGPVGPTGAIGPAGPTGPAGSTVYIDVRSAPYNAPWNGVSDDSAAVLAAVTALVSTGGVIQLPPGQGLFTTAVRLPSNLTRRIVIQGHGKDGTTIKMGSSSSGRAFDFAPFPTIGDSFSNISLQDFTLDANNLSSASGDHVLIGTLQAGSVAAQVNVQNIAIRRIRVINVANPTSNSQGRRGTMFSIWHPDINLAQNTVSNILVEDYEQTGGSYAVGVMAQSTNSAPANVYFDDIVLRRIRHYKTRTPTFFSSSAGIQVGSAGWGRRCLIDDVYIENSEDAGIEVDNLTDVTVQNVLAVDNWNEALLINNFVAAGTSYPTTTRLNNGGLSLDPGATSLTVDASAGFTVGGTIMISRTESRVIQTIPDGVTLTLTGPTGLVHSDRAAIYQCNSLQAQRFRVQNLQGRRTSASRQGGGIVIQNSNNPTPLGHVEINGGGWYRNGGSDAGIAGEALKCQTGVSGDIISPTGNPLSLTVNNYLARTENVVYTSSSTATAQPFYLVMRGPRCLVTIKNCGINYSGTATGSGLYLGVLLYTSGVNIDLYVDNLTTQFNVANSNGQTWKIAELNANEVGNLAWTIRGLKVLPSLSGGGGSARGLQTRHGGAYASSVTQTTLSADAAIGATTLSVPNTTGFAAGQKIAVDTLAINSEVHTIASLVANTSITLVSVGAAPGLAIARTTGAVIAPLNQMILEDSDFTGLGATPNTIAVTDAATLQGVKISNTIYATPQTPVTVTPPASATAFTVADGHNGQLAINGGTGTLVEWSPDGTNWFSALTQAAGALNTVLPLASGQFVRITYTVVPTVKRLVALR